VRVWGVMSRDSCCTTHRLYSQHVAALVWGGGVSMLPF
jgi:hypothetical protein